MINPSKFFPQQNRTGGERREEKKNKTGPCGPIKEHLAVDHLHQRLVEWACQNAACLPATQRIQTPAGKLSNYISNKRPRDCYKQ